MSSNTTAAMTTTVINQAGQFAIAGSLLIATIIGATQAGSAMNLWKQQLKNDAIDGCFAASNYSQETVESDDKKANKTKVDSFPIAWMFDDCLKNKGIVEGYTRTDFSQQAQQQETASPAAEIK